MCKEKGKSVALAPASTSHTRPLCIEQANHSPVSHARRLRPQPQDNAQTRRSTASFRYVRRERCSILTKTTALHNAEPKLCSWNCPPTSPALCGDGRLRWKSLITGYTDPIAAAACSGRSACCGGIANLTMRKCRKRSRGKHTFGTAQDSRQVCLFHLETRGHAENILVPKEPPAMHAPVLHFARLRYDTPLNHATCASALLKIATPRTDPSKPHRIAPNDFDLIVEWLNTQNGEDTHRHRISQVGISDKRSAITLNQVGRTYQA